MAEAGLDAAGRVNDTALGRARGFVDALAAALPGNVQAALLFGSAARGEWIEGTSDVNVLVLVDALDGPRLARAAAAARAALEDGVTPLLMARDEWRRAADVFALELADMQDAGVPLLGDSPVAGVALRPAHMRLQAERELRAKLLHLHGAMMLASDQPARLGQLMKAALPSFATYMRALLRLHDSPVPADTAAVTREACGRAGVDAGPFQAALDARRSGAEIRSSLERGSLVDRFNEAATGLATFIDNFGR